MWKLKIAEGDNPWLRTVNGQVGRQIWEFDPKLGSPEELVKIEKARENFRKDRFQRKHSVDLLISIQVERDPTPLHINQFANGEWRFSTGGDYGGLQQKLHDHVCCIQKHFPNLGIGRVSK
ncbi:cycloartenol Synthase-like [Actinidia eriantha]|uniref:cycloartenol Synthase-like n=1 Tax=Actinidia eriantha TaxID=165200 RepID=UPI002583C4F9|nr:cycloartenol Synthase-like [Actinidia eriantha]